MNNTNQLRKENYKKLKDVGYNSYEANRYKDRSEKKIKQLLDARNNFNGEILNLLGGSKNG